MSEIYDATYSAIRSKINHCDPSTIIENWLSGQAFSHLLNTKIEEVGNELMRPCVLLKPKLTREGDCWCALYGENLHDGIAGFGKTPSEAFYNFDHNFFHEKTFNDLKKEGK